MSVIDERSAVSLQIEIADDAGLGELRKSLAKLAPAVVIPVAIERPSGLIVETLIDAGHSVVLPSIPISSKPAAGQPRADRCAEAVTDEGERVELRSRGCRNESRERQIPRQATDISWITVNLPDIWLIWWVRRGPRRMRPRRGYP